MYRTIHYFSGTLGIMEDPPTVGILVWFVRTCHNIGVCSSSFSECNFTTGTTDHVSSSFSESFPRMIDPSESKPFAFMSVEKFTMTNLTYFQVNTTHHPTLRFPYRSLAHHSTSWTQPLPRCAQYDWLLFSNYNYGCGV